MLKKRKMANETLRPGERLDDLLIGGYKVIQGQTQFRFSLDAVLLGHFAAVKPGAAAVDLGSGTGVLGLILLARGGGTVTGVEINPVMADMSRRSAALNNVAERMSIVCGDIRDIGKGLLPPGRADLVVANPPYRPPGGGKVSPRDEVAVARHEIAGGLKDFAAAAAVLLKMRGRLAMIHLPERLADVVAELRAAGVEPKRLRFVHPSAAKKAKMILVEGVRGVRPGLEVLPPLMICDAAGGYSGEIMSYYQAGE